MAAAVGAAGEAENEGTGRAGDDISGALKAGAWNGAGILGRGRDVSACTVFSAGGGGGDL